MPTGYDFSDIQYENIVLRDKNSDLENENEELHDKLVSKWCNGWEKFMQGICVGLVVGVGMMAFLEAI